MTDVLVIGGGPAGLAAAEVALEAGLDVTLTDQKPSLARKFLMAGKSGLNITQDAPLDHLQGTIDCAQLDPILAAFDADAVKRWAEGLGQPIFTGSSGMVFPVAMKASPLLRAWLKRLAKVDVKTEWRWTGFEGDGHAFDTPGGRRVLSPRAAIFALGGASWARLGSDGTWADIFATQGFPLTPFAPANMGVNIAWSEPMAKYFGAPVKNVELRGDTTRKTGEFVITREGLQGSLIYALSREIREGEPLMLDLKPGLSEAEITDRLSRQPAKQSLSNKLRKAVGIAGPLLALLYEFGRPGDPDLATQIKNLPIRHQGPRPMDEAISVAGGLAWEALDAGLMLKDRPGTFCAGEMLDWEAPTGGYLITACMATGRWAGRAAVEWLARG